MHVIREQQVINIREICLILALLRLAELPLPAEILDLVYAVELRVVVLADASPALPQRQVAWVHRDAVIFGITALAQIHPAAFLLFEIETRGVGEEEPGDQHSGETEPGDEVEFHLVGKVVVEDGCEEGAHLAAGGGETVGGGADGGRVHFGGDEEGDAVGAKLIEEGGEEVHGLEGVDSLDGLVIIIVESWHDEENEVHEETELHHTLATDELVIDQERGEVVTA